MQAAEKIRRLLPEEAAGQFDDITQGRVLGAGTHIRMIGNMMLAIAGMEISPGEIVSRCMDLGEYFKETRGKSSYAIVSAVNLMTGGFAGGEPGPGSARLIRECVEAFFVESAEAAGKIVEYFTRLVENRHMKTLMVFDYSSTVEKCLCGLQRPVTVYVPESRIIDGGRPFVKPFVQAGHKVRFIADAAMLTVLREVDGVFIGAETFYPDGTAFNTAGSDLLAEVCRLYRVPYYVLTPLLKVDMRAAGGTFKQVISTDLAGRLGAGWPGDLRDAVDFHSIELVAVGPELVTAFVTEEGIIPAAAMFQTAAAYDRRVNEGRD